MVTLHVLRQMQLLVTESVNGTSSSPTATITNNSSSTEITCNLTSISVTGGGAGTGGSYSWDNGAGNSVITLNPSSNTTYTLTATDANGCSDRCYHCNHC